MPVSTAAFGALEGEDTFQLTPVSQPIAFAHVGHPDFTLIYSVAIECTGYLASKRGFSAAQALPA
jgi:hypothetical protein